MNKENQLNSPHTPIQDDSLTPQQKARISAKFRAAKALLARKKPRISTPPLLPRIPNLFDSNCSFEVRIHERVPLKELQTNSGSLPASRVSDQRDNTYVGVSSLSCNFTDRLKDSSIKSQRDGQIKDENISTPINVQVQRSESSRVSDQRDNKYVGVPSLLCNFTDRLIDSSITNQRDGQIKDENVSTPINAQVRRSESLNLNNCTPVSSVLDEDFDSSIFEEIDLLCNESFVKQCHKEDANSLCDGSSVKFEPVKFELDDGSNSNTRSSSHTRLENHCTELDIIAAKELSGLPESYLKYLESLNEDQLEAASTDASTPLMVVAGPGSGKTSTMVGRVLMLLNQGIGPSHILALTFTTAAASEMRDRVGAIAGKEVAKALTMSTFHSFSLQLCRAHADKLGRSSEFLIYGHGQQRRAVIEAVRIAESKRCVESVHNCDLIPPSGDASIQDFKDKSQKWQKFVTQAKASGKKPEECFQKGDEFGGKVLSYYNDILKSCNALDYHDLISCSVDLLTNYPEVRAECQGLWKAIIVDEFQDTSSMQYDLLGLLVSHGQITIVGDDDQSIFSFNGANISGFDSFCKDFPRHKEVRLKKNYRSTRCIVEAAASLIQHNVKRCQLKQVLTDNVSGSKITVKECSTEVAQCSYVVDKVLEIVLNSSDKNGSFGDIAILYRRQVSGRIFQATFRDRKIPFNVHGVAFYRKKVIKAIMAMVKTTLPKCDDGPFRQAFKTFLPYEKEEKKKIIEHIDKISTVRKCSFISAASDIFSAKISGTFKRNQLSQGRKVLLTLEMISKLVYREQSISSVITSIANFLPQKYLLQQQAVISIDGGKLLNEDNDVRSVLAYLLDDVTDFLSSHFVPTHTVGEDVVENKGCIPVLQAFVDYISEREKENFKSRRHDNQDSVTLTTIHQSKGLEWDIVFIVKANDSEIPLLHEHNGITKERGNSLEEERRLLYVAMTRARKKLFILYVTMDSNWQVLHPSRFLREIPAHLLESQADMSLVENKNKSVRVHSDDHLREAATGNHPPNRTDEASEDLRSIEASSANGFLKKFDVEDRGLISRLFHQWAKKKAFQDPKRLLDKVNFVIDERLQTKKANKDILVALKSFLKCDEAFQFADHVIKWQQIPADKRVHLSRERQEHFQKLRMETAMGSSSATSKQIGYLHKLGCTVVPESKLHASRLIEQYKTL